MKEMTEEEKIDFCKSQFATESFIGTKLFIPKQSNTISMVDKSRLDNFLKNPYANYSSLQEYSNLLMTKKGLYFSMIKLLSVLMTYDYSLIPYISPNLFDKKTTSKKVKDSYSQACLYTQKMKIKENAIKFTEDFLRDGECYYYKIEDNNGIIYMKIPNKYCLPYENENGVWRYVIDCSKLASCNDITIYPQEIQKAMEIYEDKELSSNLIYGRYYKPKNGICFTMEEQARHSIPPFSFIFGNLYELDEKRDLKDTIDRINNVKMIHNKIDLKDDKTSISIQDAKKYNEAMKKGIENTGLGKNMICMTNPFTPSLLNLKNDSANSNSSNMVKDSIEELYDEIGLNKDLFNCSSSSSNAMDKSITTITSYCINMIFNKIKDYINYELSNLKGEVKMVVKIYESTIYNRENMRKTAKENMLVGGSKLEFLNLGYTPLEANNLLAMEKVLEIDKLFVPLQTSYTMSSKESGRPSSEKMKENGQETSESIDIQKDKNIGNN